MGMKGAAVSDMEARRYPSLPGVGPHPLLQLRRKGPSVCVPTALVGDLRGQNPGR